MITSRVLEVLLTAKTPHNKQYERGKRFAFFKRSLTSIQLILFAYPSSVTYSVYVAQSLIKVQCGLRERYTPNLLVQTAIRRKCCNSIQSCNLLDALLILHLMHF